MFFAIKNNLWDMAEMILNHGANVALKDESTPPLILALKTKTQNNEGEKLAFIKSLITKKNINLDAEDENGCTALSYAVSNQYWEIIDLLTKAGVKVFFKLVEEIKNPDILTQIVRLNLKPYKDKSELTEQDEEQVNTVQKQKTVQEQETYKLKFMSTSLKDYTTLSEDVKMGVDDVIKLLKINPYDVAKEALQGNYGSTNFGEYGYVRAYSAQPQSTKKGRVAYIVIEKQKEVWIIEANDKHYGFMNRYDSLKELLNKAIFKEFDLEDSENKESEDNTLIEDKKSGNYETEKTEEYSIEEEIITDPSIFDSSITNQTRDITKYLLDHNIGADKYMTFLQNMMNQMNQKR